MEARLFQKISGSCFCSLVHDKSISRVGVKLNHQCRSIRSQYVFWHGATSQKLHSGLCYSVLFDSFLFALVDTYVYVYVHRVHVCMYGHMAVRIFNVLYVVLD